MPITTQRDFSSTSVSCPGIANHPPNCAFFMLPKKSPKCILAIWLVSSIKSSISFVIRSCALMGNQGAFGVLSLLSVQMRFFSLYIECDRDRWAVGMYTLYTFLVSSFYVRVTVNNLVRCVTIHCIISKTNVLLTFAGKIHFTTVKWSANTVKREILTWLALHMREGSVTWNSLRYIYASFLFSFPALSISFLVFHFFPSISFPFVFSSFPFFPSLFTFPFHSFSFRSFSFSFHSPLLPSHSFFFSS